MERDEHGRFVKGKNIIDLTGQKFGRLTVVGLDKERTKRKSYWICKCECGNVKSVRSDTLRVVKSCGCLKKEQDLINIGVVYNHNMTYHKAFPIWNAMMHRCSNPNSHAYKDYGGRGISVCDEWKDVKNFCKWMDDNHYEKGLSVERKDVNGNYCPENCCLIPRNEQCLNTRKTVYVEINGRRFPLAKEARKLGVSANLVIHRWKSGITDYDKLFYKGNLREYKA